MHVRYLLETPTTRLPLTGGSVLIGRSLDCDVVLADTRVLPQALGELWARLKPAFAAA